MRMALFTRTAFRCSSISSISAPIARAPCRRLASTNSQEKTGSPWPIVFGLLAVGAGGAYYLKYGFGGAPDAAKGLVKKAEAKIKREFTPTLTGGDQWQDLQVCRKNAHLWWINTDSWGSQLIEIIPYNHNVSSLPMETPPVVAYQHADETFSLCPSVR